MSIQRIKNKIEIVFRHNGKQYRRRFDSELDAYKFKAQITGETKTEKSIELSRIIPEYITYSKINKSERTWRSDIHRLRIFANWCRENRIELLAEITPKNLEGFKAYYLENAPFYSSKRYRPAANSNPRATFNKYLQLVKALINWAVRMDYISESRISRVKPFPADRKRHIRYFSKEELRMIFASAESPYREYFQVLAYTGMRVGELQYLEWSDIDLNNGLIKIQAKANFHPKTYSIRTIPINAPLAKIIGKILRSGRYLFDGGADTHLFTGNATLCYLKRILLKNDLPDGNLYSFRHTFGSHLIQAGVDIISVKELMGHQSIMTTQQYLHSDPRTIRAAIENLEY